jgi:hypothetical protein
MATLTYATQLSPLTVTALERIAAATADHQPGQPYRVDRDVFSRFWRNELQDCIRHFDHADRANLWVAIASHEAARQFDPDHDYCQSELVMSTEHGCGTVQWWYKTTRGTQLHALDSRSSEPPGLIRWLDVLDEFENILPWRDDSENPVADIPLDGFYAITIPAERDQPGRCAWMQVRLAMSGLDYREWSQLNECVDDTAVARSEVMEMLRAQP